MLTVGQLAVLIKYHWTAALFAAQATAPERALMQGLDWQRLAALLNEVKLYQKGLVAPEYAQKIHAELLAVCADTETAEILLGYASTL